MNRINVVALFGAAILAALAAPGHASTLEVFGIFCQPYFPGGGNVSPPQTCVESAVGGTGPGDELGFNGSPVSADAVGLPGWTSSTAGASGSLAGTASATANFGVLKARVETTNSYPLGTEPLPNVAARAFAGFTDVGPVTSGSLPTGGLAHAKVTLDVAAILGGLGEATVKLVIGGSQSGTFVNYEGLLFNPVNAISKTFEFDTLVGEDITVAALIRAQANAGNSNFTQRTAASADLSNSAYLYIDVDDAMYAALSGHDYRLDAVSEVPLPATLPLLATGFGVIGHSRLRSRRRIAQAAMT